MGEGMVTNVFAGTTCGCAGCGSYCTTEFECGVESYDG
jgi:hypothetical protein